MISTTATQEADIEAQVSDILFRWKEVDFNFKAHSESSPNPSVVLLAGNSDMQELLDETLTQVVNLLGNRFVKHHLEKVTKLSDQLNLLSETYDLWREAQRGWLYLDNIFSSPEIRGDCPAEAKTFASQTNKLLQTLKKVKSRPNALLLPSHVKY